MYKNALDFFHNIYSLFYCVNVVFLTFYTIKDDSINFAIYDKIYEYSSYYFGTSIILNLLDQNYLYVLHHLICVLNLSVVYYNPDILYIRWLNTCLLTEISTMFLSLSKVLKYYIGIKKNKKSILHKIKKISDYLFASSYLLVRICYVCPVSIFFLLNYKFKNIYLGIFINTITFAMIGLNLYWAKQILIRINNN